MGRMFQATIDAAAAATQRDIIELTAGTGFPIKIHEVLITTDIETDANEVQIELEVSRNVGAFTGGSGGTANVTCYSLDVTGATEDNATLDVGNTTQITGGTKEILGNIMLNNRIGHHYLPTPEARITVDATDAFVIGLTAAPASTGFYGYVIFEELIG